MTIYTDGGSRGNPGKAACAVIFIEDQKIVFEEGYYLGVATNNVAEYQGLVKALMALKKYTNLKGVIYVNMDSELIVKQMNGLYAIKDSTLKNLAQEARGLIKEIGPDIKIILRHIKRAENKLADALVNFTLDHVRPDSADNHT